jgi:UDP-glucose 4-epimerase
MPTAFLRLLGTISGRGEAVQRLTGNLVVDIAKSRQVLDWRPPATLDAGLAETARWFRSQRA